MKATITSRRPSYRPSAQYISAFGQVAYMLGRGHEPIAMYSQPHRSGTGMVTVYVFSVRAKKAADAYEGVRSQLKNTPEVRS